MQSPEEACRRLKLAGPARIALVDELFVHRQMAAAHAVASYLAAEVFPSALRTGRRALDRALPKVVFLRQKATQILIESGRSYEQARFDLIEIEALQKQLPRDKENLLLIANTHLLRARLLQLLNLPDRAGGELDAVERVLARARYSLPDGWELFRVRTTLFGDSRTRRSELLTPYAHSQRHYAENLYGGQAEHYRLYLLAHNSIERKEWDAAISHFDDAKTALHNRRHDGFEDPIRRGYLVLGRAQARAELGLQTQRPPEVEAGLRGLLKARWDFHDVGFTPGEFIAYREFVQMSERLERLTRRPRYVSSAKEMLRIGRASGVAVWHLEAGVRRVDELIEEGRPNAANATLLELRDAINGDALVAEVKKTPEWRGLEARIELTADAADNGVAPLVLWGLSDYAKRELKIVTAASVPPHFIVSAAPAGGRGILFTRIMEARNQDDMPLWPIDVPSVGGTVAAVVEAKLTAGKLARLSDFDLWQKEDQREVLTLLAAHPEWHELVYLALSRPLFDEGVMSELSQDLIALLVPASLQIEPLTQRPQDTLLLARGFLVRSLRRKGVEEAKQLIFTGRACALIRQRYHDIVGLSRAMVALANHLDFGRDTISMSDGRCRLPAEVLERLLPSSRARVETPSAPPARRRTR